MSHRGTDGSAASPRLATARACANIAFVKYWGNRDAALRLPYNSSLSMNLHAATTTTSVVFDQPPGRDSVEINGTPAGAEALERVSKHLDLVRRLGGLSAGATVQSENTFPMGAGIASSASGFAALTCAAAVAAGLDLDERRLSALARRGSGSAARSVPTGYVEWHAGTDDDSSYAESIAPPDYWDLTDLVAVVSRAHKALGSTDGHAAAEASPLFRARIKSMDATFALMRDALFGRDLARLGEMMEAEALSLHAIAMTGTPSALYWTGGTVELLSSVRQWRDAGLPVYFTLDAGPNVHMVCESAHAPDVEREARRLHFVDHVLMNRPGPGVAVLD